jgi:hypothetical protein
MTYSGPWRVARSLDVLLAQINAQAPKRSKASDGSIADDLHSTSSDHYPKVIAGLGSIAVVLARDFTHDPADDADMNVVAERLRRSKDPRIRYVIWNRRIFSGFAGPQPWVWRAYSGDNPHDKHLHASAVADARADNVSKWDIEPEEQFMAALTDADQKALVWRVEAIASGRPAVAGGPTKGEPVVLNVRLAAMEQRQNALTTAIAALDEEVATRLRVEFERIEADEAATLAAVEQAAAEDAVRDAELRALVEQAQSGELDAAEVVRLIGEKLTAGSGQG